MTDLDKDRPESDGNGEARKTKPAKAADASQITEDMEKAVGVRLEDLSDIFLLESIKQFGPQKFKGLDSAKTRPRDVLKNPELLPIKGKRGDMFREGTRSLKNEAREECHLRAVNQILAAHKYRATILTYYVEKTKTGRPRTVPLSARSIETLKPLRQDASDEEEVFYHTRTGRKRRQMLVCFTSALQEAEVVDFHFHDLRHTFAIRLRAASVHQMDIMTLLGHTTLKVTLGYALATQQRLIEAIDALSNGRVLEFAPSRGEMRGRGSCKPRLNC